MVFLNDPRVMIWRDRGIQDYHSYCVMHLTGLQERTLTITTKRPDERSMRQRATKAEIGRAGGYMTKKSTMISSERGTSPDKDGT